MAYTFYESVVEHIIDETPNVKRYFIKVTGIPKFEFVAGQFVMLNLPIDSKITTRAYSIASAPSLDNVIELVIVLNEDGLGTPYLFDEINIGDKIPISQPLGKFIRPRPQGFDQDLVFICTGTGIAPFRSMVLDILNHKIPHKDIYLIKGCRKAKDVLYFNEMTALDKAEDSFHFIPVLSRESEQEWTGQTGYVHQVYENLFTRFDDKLFYLCGWKQMVMEARQKLQDLGVAKDNIRFELYD